VSYCSHAERASARASCLSARDVGALVGAEAASARASSFMNVAAPRRLPREVDLTAFGAPSSPSPGGAAPRFADE
jgi:hypothetical protein